MKDTTRKQPFKRNDKKGKWRNKVSAGGKDILTNYSWDTKTQAEDWVRWNNFDEGLYGDIVPNPEI